MLVLPENIRFAYVHFLSTREFPKHLLSRFQKWLCFYLDFCHEYQLASANVQTLELFLLKLAEKRHTEKATNEATMAVQFYYEMLALQQTPIKHDSRQGKGSTHTVKLNKSTLKGFPSTQKTMKRVHQHALQPEKNTGRSWETEYTELENAIAMRRYSEKTLRSYKKYIRDFQTYTKSLSPQMLTPAHVKDFLTFLAVNKKVSASTQNLAFNSLLFFYRHVLNKEFGRIDGVVRAKRKTYIPVVLSRNEIDQICSVIEDPYKLIVKLLYGCGLRLSECLMLRVQCLNLDNEILTVHDGKGKKDRTVPIPQVLKKDLIKQLQTVQQLHNNDMAKDYDGVFMFDSFERKSKNAAREFIWQWLFPARQLSKVQATGKMKRSHLHVTHVQKAIRRAAKKAYLTKRVTAHTFRHSFASHLLQNNYDIRTIQELLGHSDVRTTMIYTHTVKSVTLKEAKSPLDFC